MNNLKKFTTEAEYSAATLNYPAVSWVTSGDTVHFDKTAPIVPNDKIMMCWTTPSDVHQAEDIVLYNTAGSPSGNEYFDAITLNDTDITSQISNGVLYDATIPNSAVTYILKYSINAEFQNQFSDAFTGELGGGWGSETKTIDLLIPSSVTLVINDLPSNPIQNLVIEATTPPITPNNGASGWSQGYLISAIYVPDSAVNTYKEDVSKGWGEVSSKIYPISEYNGNLPV